jgi:NADH:ubiquinone oxidoreductase subunit 6 (subunit J)
MEFAIFFLFAAIAVIFALVVILHRNPVVGALSLVACFFALAVMYVLLEAPFVAALQVIVAILVARGTLASAFAGVQVQGISAELLIGYLPGILFILYVLISEIWMKVYRFKIFADLNTIDYLDEHFTISKQRDAQLPKPHLKKFFDFSDTENQNYVGHGPLVWFFNPD